MSATHTAVTGRQSQPLPDLCAAWPDGGRTVRERDGLLSRTAYAEVPPRVEYQLTPLGDSLRAVVTALAQWATDHDDEIKTARHAFDNRR